MIFEKKTCDNCVGLDSCVKYCDIRVGENIVNFVNGIDSVESTIGELRAGEEFDRPGETIMVIGYELAKGSNPMTVYGTPPKNGVVLQGKLKDYNGSNPIQMLRKYTGYCKLPNPVQSKAMDDLKKFNSNKIIPTPFKVGADIEVIHKGFDNKSHRTLSNADFIKWRLDGSGELVGTILVHVGRTDTGSNYAKVKFSEYGINWFLPNLERNLKTSEITYEAIRMSNLGLIDPIEVTDGKTTLAVDSQHMYLVKGSTITIVGDWTPNGMKENPEFMSSIHKTKAYKKLNTCMKFIEKHRRFIVPYGLSEANKLEA